MPAAQPATPARARKRRKPPKTARHPTPAAKSLPENRSPQRRRQKNTPMPELSPLHEISGLSPCSSARRPSTATPTSIWSRLSARTGAQSSASSAILDARKPCSPQAPWTGWSPRLAVSPSAPWFCAPSTRATRAWRYAGSVRLCCSGGSGRRPGAGRSYPSF